MASDSNNKPLVDYPFLSVIVDTLLSETSSKYVGNWTPIEPGTPFAAPPTHSAAEAAKFAGTISLGQRAGKNDEDQQRFWATTPHTQDVYNYNISYENEVEAFPNFKRRYREKRDEYEHLKRARNSAFTGLYAIYVDNPGLGYDSTNPPAVTCTGGAIAIAIVDPADGSITKITLKQEGSAVTNVVTIAAPPSGGTQATAIGILQPATCVMVSETTGDTPEPWDALYLLVERIYNTIPGPTLNSSTPRADGIPINVATTKDYPANIHPGEVLTGGIYTRTTLKQSENGLFSYSQVETSPIPGPWILDKEVGLDPLDASPVYENRRLVDANLIAEGESDVPPNFGTQFVISAIDVAADSVITLTADHGLSIGMWVQFLGTDSTPPLPNSVQIIGVPNTNQVAIAFPVTIAGTTGTMQPMWSRTTEVPFEGGIIAWEYVKTRLLPGPVKPSQPRLDYDSQPWAVNKTVTPLPITAKVNVTLGGIGTYSRTVGAEYENSTKVGVQLDESRSIPGLWVFQDVELDPVDSSPVYVQHRLRDSNAIAEGESAVPPNYATQFSITSISSGGSSTITLSAPHGLSIGMFVQFLNTNSTPPLPLSVQIVGITSSSVTIVFKVTSGGTSGTMQPLWVRTTERAFETDGIAWEEVRTRLAIGPTKALQPRTDYDGLPWSVNSTVKPLPIAALETLITGTYTNTKGTDFDGSTKMGVQIDEARTIPGLWVFQRVDTDGLDGAPLYVQRRIQDTNAITEGESDVPPNYSTLFTVTAISIAVSSVITLSAPHGLSVGMWVQFAGTNSTPALPPSIQITSVTSSTIAVAFAVTGSGTSGTMQPMWLRTALTEWEGGKKIAWEEAKTRTLPGPIDTSTPELDPLDSAPMIVARTVVKTGTVTSGELPVSGGLWPRTTETDIPGSTKISFQTVRSRAVPGPTIPDTPELDPADGVPLFINETIREKLNVLEGEGDVPANTALQTVSTISTGATPTITLSGSHGLSTGNWVQFLSTNSTPALPICAQITSTGATTVTISLPAAAPITIGGSAGTMQALWPRTTTKSLGSKYVTIEVVRARVIPGPTRPSKPRIDDDKGVWSVNRTLTEIVAAAAAASESGTSTVTVTTQQDFENSVKVAWLQAESRTLPGNYVTESGVGPGDIPILIATRKVSDTVLYTEGEFQPAAVGISIIGLGSTPLVTTSADHDLPIGAWVKFSGTNSTPTLGTQTTGSLVVGNAYTITTFAAGDNFLNVGASANASGVIFTATGTAPTTYSNGSVLTVALRVLSTPSSTTFTVATPAAITIAGTASGTVTPPRLVREIKTTRIASIKSRIDSIVSIPDVNVAPFFENVVCKKEYEFPNYLKALNFYAEPAYARTIGASGTSISASWGGGMGIPMQAGYRGPCDARRLRFFFVGQPPDSFASTYQPTIIIPSIGTFVVTGGSFAEGISLSGGSSNSNSNNVRTGVIPSVLTGPSPAVTNSAATIAVSSISITSPASATTPKITLVSAHGMSAGAFVKLSGTTCVPSLDGVWQTISATGSVFQVQPPVALTSGQASPAGTAQILTTSGAQGAGVASVTLDLPESIPAKIIGKLIVNTIGTSATPTITLSANHYLRVGQTVELSGTNSTPTLNGFFQVQTVPGANQITVSAVTPVTGAQSSPAGTLQNYITIVEQPRKDETAGIWECYVWFIKVPYTSGDAPP